MSKEDKKKNKQKDNSNTLTYIIRLMIVLCVVLFAILVLRMSIKYFSSIIKKDMAYNGVMSESVNISGMVLYDYQSYPIPEAFDYIKAVEDGQRVGVGALMCSFASVQNPLYPQLKEINSEILFMDQLYNINTGIKEWDLKLAEQQINNRLQAMMSVLVNQTMHESTKIKSEIELYNNYKQDIQNDNLERKQRLEDLHKSRTVLKTAMASDIRDIYSTQSGYVTYRNNIINKINYDTAKDMLPNDLAGYFSQSQAAGSSAELRLVTSRKYYIASILSDSETAKINEARKVKIAISTVNGDLVIDADRVIVGNSKDGQNIVFFECVNHLSELAALDVFEGKVIIQEFHGIKVPVSAIRNYRYSTYQKPSIGVLKGITVRFVEVEIIYSDDINAIVSKTDKEYTFKVYDYYVLEPDKVKDGDIIN